MAMANGGELIVLAPGLKEFGEDQAIDSLIRKYGYRSRDVIIPASVTEKDLNANLGAAAHLIHGCPEDRFSVTYCTGFLTKNEIESVGFNYSPVDSMMKIYDPAKLREGYNIMRGNDVIFFISNPALGLWTEEKRFCKIQE